MTRRAFHSASPMFWLLHSPHLALLECSLSLKVGGINVPFRASTPGLCNIPYPSLNMCPCFCFFFRLHLCISSCNIFLSVSGLSHIVKCLLNHGRLQDILTPLYTWTTFSNTIHLCIHVKAVFTSCLLPRISVLGYLIKRRDVCAMRLLYFYFL